MSTSHTPGPWKAQGDTVWTDTPSIPLRIATITRFAEINGIDTEANAQLIAAAPDVLEACELLLAVLDKEIHLKALVKQGDLVMINYAMVSARDAIAKAKGNSK